MNVAYSKALSNVKCCKMVSSQEQRVFIITNYFQNDPMQLALKDAFVCNQHYLASISHSSLSRIVKIMCNDEYPLLSGKYRVFQK